MRGLTQVDVDAAADALLRAGERPTVEKVRLRIGSGSPNTILPLLDAWWKRLSARVRTGATAFERLPASAAHMAEALFLNLIDEARQRAKTELHSELSKNSADRNRNEERSLVLSWREREMTEQLQRAAVRVTQLEEQLQKETLQAQLHLAAKDAAERKVAQLLEEIAVLDRRLAARRRGETIRPASKKVPKSKRSRPSKTRQKSKKRKAAPSRRR